MAALMPLERWLTRGEAPTPRAVFIVGPPRAGTTLVFESLVTKFRCAFFSNIAHRLDRTPVAATMLWSKQIRSWQGRFTSDYGHIPGWSSPNEGGRFWSRWLPEDGAKHVRTSEIQETIGHVSAILGAPFVSKNVMLATQMNLLDTLFPGCLFVHCRRNVIDNARSILRARLHDCGPDGLGNWVSVKPPGWRQFESAPPSAQAVAQIELVHQAIGNAASRLGPDRVVDVQYESLCDSPRQVMSSIKSWALAHGTELAERGEIPVAFTPSAAKPLEGELEAGFVESLEQWSAGSLMSHAACVGSPS